MKLIVTADDYGMSPGVNEGIERCIKSGIVTSTNVIMNMPYYSSAIEVKRKYPHISFGLHWTVSCGKPLSDPKNVSTLVDANGNFFSPSIFVEKMKHKKINLTELTQELILQYDEYVRLFGEPEYWNTHQNVHVNLYAFDFFFTLALQLNIKKMRYHKKVWIKPKNNLKNSLKFNFMENLKLVVLNSWKRKMIHKGVKSPNGLATFIDSKESFIKMDFGDRMISNNIDVVELVIHPATKIDSIFQGSLTNRRVSEFSVFSKFQMKQYLEKYFELTSYKSI